MARTGPTPTRRQLLHGLAAVGGLGLAEIGLRALGLAGGPAFAQQPSTTAPLPAGSLTGKRVVVIGAGVAGLCAALRLARAGAEVEVLEAANRTGGRSLTLRHGDKFAETDWNDPTEMRFETVGDVPPDDPGNYFNAGPGRIPQHHGRVLDYCRELGVALEPYIYATGANLMQNDAWNGGKPVQLRRLVHDLRGHLAELLAKVQKQGTLDQTLNPAETAAFLGMLEQFGQLTAEGAELVYKGAATAYYPRAGYRINPTTLTDRGEPWPTLTLDEVLASNFWRGGMFNELSYYWQATMLQPVGGMDRIADAFRHAAVPGNRTVDDLIKLDQPVRGLHVTDEAITVITADGKRPPADYVVATMAPKLLAALDGNAVTPAAKAALTVLYHAPAFKVGWQARSRFWEIDDRIYGGISWTGHPITQFWYPSSGFHSATGALTGAYNSGRTALQFQSFSRPDRLEAALAGGEKLHPGFRDKVFAENGVSIAWARMPHMAGGWTGESFLTDADSFARLRDTGVHPRVGLAGDWFSFWPGWQEGSLDSAHDATDRIAGQVARKG